jgi:integrase
MADKKEIGLRDIRGLECGQMRWDAMVAGFGIRRQKSTSVTYFIQYRTKEGRLRWYTIGTHGAKWTPTTARKEARRLFGMIESGFDPSGEKESGRDAPTIADLCDKYLEDAKAGRLLTRRQTAKKESTLATDEGRIERHIKPLLGKHKVAAVSNTDIENFMHSVAEGKTKGRFESEKKHGLSNVRGGKGTASRTVGLLGAIFTYAVRHRMRPDNPVHGIMRFADGKRERRLSDDEYKALGEALQKAEATNIWPPAIAAIRFLALTGWRSGEALNLRWKEVDLTRRTATLADTKTGRSVRPLSLAACDVLKNVVKIGTGKLDDLVFPPTRGEGVMSGFPKLWARIAKLPESPLPDDITPHVLRHSFASLAGDLGYSEPTIAALVGHKGHSITSRYIHAADAVLLAAGDTVANRTAELMGEAKAEAKIVPLRRA